MPPETDPQRRRLAKDPRTPPPQPRAGEDRGHLRFRGPFPSRLDSHALGRLIPVLIAGLLLILTAVPWPVRPPRDGTPAVRPTDAAAVAALHTRIAEINRRLEAGGFHWVAGVTGISHLDRQQFRRLLGARVPPGELARFARLTADATPLPDLPSCWDWREQIRALQGAPDQGSCGSCWAFSAAGAMEGLAGIYTGQILDLSEQHVLDCNEEAYDCAGGWMTAAYRLWRDWGAVREAELPYAAEDGRECQTQGLTPVVSLADWEAVSAHRTALQQALLGGPIAVAMHAYDDFQHYERGIYWHAGSDAINHAVLLVGWDDHRQAWIIRNSWGTDWGDAGYAYVGYDCCRLGTYAHRIVWNEAHPLRLVHEPLPPLSDVDAPIEIRILATTPGGALSEAELVLHFEAGEEVGSVPMAPEEGDRFAARFSAALPALPLGSALRYEIEARSAAGVASALPAGDDSVFQSRMLRLVYTTDFAAPGGWTAEPPGGGAAGGWAWG
ncbi:MAG: hypothetical protein GF330_11505, partial [Candidatus Eisenbacteria bacterium]|nr:hypothetical protein [Candidatus Eisenbacteria bacterium]